MPGTARAGMPNLAILRAQEEERRRLARELHDGPAQLLANVVLRMDVCQRLAEQDPKRLRDELQQLKDLLRLSLQEVRQVIFNLRPMALDLGLVPALRSYVQEYQRRTALAVELTSSGPERRLDPDLEVGIFRLIQEALTNAQKHARASRVQIALQWHPGRLQVTVQDNGVGFDPGRVVADGSGSHFGLLGMTERVGLLGGSLKVDARPGHGTRITFNLPTEAAVGQEG